MKNIQGLSICWIVVLLLWAGCRPSEKTEITEELWYRQPAGGTFKVKMPEGRAYKVRLNGKGLVVRPDARG